MFLVIDALRFMLYKVLLYKLFLNRRQQVSAVLMSYETRIFWFINYVSHHYQTFLIHVYSLKLLFVLTSMEPIASDRSDILSLNIEGSAFILAIVSILCRAVIDRDF